MAMSSSCPSGLSGFPASRAEGLAAGSDLPAVGRDLPCRPRQQEPTLKQRRNFRLESKGPSCAATRRGEAYPLLHPVQNEGGVELGGQAASIISRVRYSRPRKDGEKLWIKIGDETFDKWSSNIRWTAVNVPIHNARPLIGHVSLDKEGFEIHHLDSKVRSWDDESQVKRVFYEEAADLVKRSTGARHAVVFDHTFRRVEGSSEPGRPMARDPVQMVHVDYTVESAEKRLADFYGSDVAKRVGRLAIINVWKPLVDVVYDIPLGLIDATTLQSGDVTAYDLVYPDRVGQNQTVHPNRDAHRWYYLPRQLSQEVILFKQSDSDRSKAQHTPHAAFKDPTAPASGTFRPRESIELRVFAFYDIDEEGIASLQTSWPL